MSRRLLALVCAVLLLGSLGSAAAAQAGTQADPLLSRSYVDGWADRFIADQISTLSARIAAIGTDTQRANVIRAVLSGSDGVRFETLQPGANIALTEGDCFTLLRGAADVRIRKGALVNVTTGLEAAAGRIDVGARYLACEDLAADLTIAEESLIMLSGAPVVARFSDCSASAWYGKSVDYAALRSLMAGTGEGNFSPDSTLTRAMFVTILGRMAGADAGRYTGVSFSDVRRGSWYAPYVEWGAQNGIISGVGGGRFAPDDPVTREQMASLIARYARAASITLPNASRPAAAFRDAAQISGWAADSVELMRQTGILSGDSEGNFRPRSGAMRSEAASVFCRLDALLQVI